MNKKGKIFSLLMSTVMALGMLSALAGCGGNVEKIPENPHVDPPAAEYKVYSVAVQYNNSNVNGSLTVDLSAGSISLSAVVNKDEQADGTVTFASSVETVATVTNEGVVTLKSAGETVISATAGTKKNEFVLIVGNSYTSTTSHTITVNGGKALGSDGSVLTTAAPGTYVTLEAEVPVHKDFVDWEVEDGLWMNGNVFKMPDHDVIISAEYIDMLYTLNIVGAKVASANEVADPEGEDGGYTQEGNTAEYAMTVYHFVYDTEVSLSTITEPKGKIFVGWDFGTKDNRTGDMGVKELDFAMPDSTLTVWAVYSPLRTNSSGSTTILTKAPSKLGTTETITNGITPGDAFPDAELDGLNGYRINIPANTGASADMPENIQGSDINSIDKGTMTIKTIFRNNSEKYAVTVELYVSFYGILSSSGNVTIQPGETKKVFFPMGLGVVSGPWWGFQVREAIGGSSSETVPLDMVVGAAPMYPNGDKLLSVSGNAEYLNFGSLTGDGWAREKDVRNDFGAIHCAIYAPNFSKYPATLSAPIVNMPAYDEKNPITYVYVRAVCNVNNRDIPTNTLAFAITTKLNDTGTAVSRHDLQFTKVGESFVFRLAIPRTADDGGRFYFTIIKPVKDSDDTYHGNAFSVQAVYNNVIGYEEN